MAPGASEDDLNLDRAGQTHALADSIFAEKSESNVQNATAPRTEPAMPRRTPRVSLIVVLPENHVVSPDLLAQGLRAHGNQEIDVVVACAGQPTNLSALQRSVGEAQFVLAPAGTSTEDLRELAMRQVPGDVVTLLGGAPIRESGSDVELFMTS